MDKSVTDRFMNKLLVVDGKRNVALLMVPHSWPNNILYWQSTAAQCLESGLQCWGSFCYQGLKLHCKSPTGVFVNISWNNTVTKVLGRIANIPVNKRQIQWIPLAWSRINIVSLNTCSLCSNLALIYGGWCRGKRTGFACSPAAIAPVRQETEHPSAV